MERKKIIVCDDHAIFREITSSFLQVKGWDVLRANSGEKCIELAKTNEVEAILLDVLMPGMGGYETAEALRKLNIKAEIILMTGFIPEADQGLAEKAKIDTVLLKPFDLKSVQEMLLQNLNKNMAPNRSNKVLVVDDEDLLREMLAMFLKKNGFEVVTCKNGKECVEMAKKESFCTIFMDIRMPELDGIRALAALRKLNIETPVVLMSGYCELTSVDEAKKMGAMEFLSKPFKPAKALDLLKQQSDTSASSS